MPPVTVHEKAIEICLKEANKAVKKGSRPYTCVLYPTHQKKKIFKNRKEAGIIVEVDRVIQNTDPTAHAAILGIRKACKSLKCLTLEGFTIVLITYPCPLCLSAIEEARPDNIVYLTPYGSVAKAERVYFKKRGFKRFGTEDELYERVKRRDYPSHLAATYKDVTNCIFVKWLKNNSTK